MPLDSASFRLTASVPLIPLSRPNRAIRTPGGLDRNGGERLAGDRRALLTVTLEEPRRDPFGLCQAIGAS
jgi:hypothetical protein